MSDLINLDRLWVSDDQIESDRAYEARVKAWVEELETDEDGRKIMPLAQPFDMVIVSPGQGERLERVTELRLRRPNGGDMRRLKLSDSKPQLALERLERISGLTAKAVDKIAEGDLHRAFVVIENFT